MAVARGESISYSNYMATYSRSWRHGSDTIVDERVGRNDTLDKTYYIAAPSFKIDFHGHRRGAGGDAAVRIKIYKWNGTNAFTKVVEKSQTLNLSVSRDWDFTYVHNRDGADSYSDHDNGDIHLFKLEAHWDAISDWFWTSIDCKLGIHTGGIEMVPNTSTYNYMWKKGSKLYACVGDYYSSSTYTSDTAFINAQKPSAYTGQAITASNAKYAYSIKEN